jgi:phosphoribosylanthranilate isomerase
VTHVIKVCGITRREDALAAIDAGATAIGFIFFKGSPRYVTPELAAELGEGIAVTKVGVFVDESAVSVEAMMRAAKLDVAQVYGGGAPEGVRVWRAVRIGKDGRWQDHLPHRDALLLDGAANGQSFDWTLARGAAERVIVAGGLDASNVAEAIRAAEAWGVDASSKLESSPGIKDHDKVRRFVAAARQAFSC